MMGNIYILIDVGLAFGWIYPISISNSCAVTEKNASTEKDSLSTHPTNKVFNIGLTFEAKKKPYMSANKICKQSVHTHAHTYTILAPHKMVLWVLFLCINWKEKKLVLRILAAYSKCMPIVRDV